MEEMISKERLKVHQKERHLARKMAAPMARPKEELKDRQMEAPMAHQMVTTLAHPMEALMGY